MKLRGYIVALLVACSSVPLAIAADEQYAPRLGDIMSAVQLRHVKLWVAGRSRNWELAAYELRQIKAGLGEAALLYSGIPVTNVTTMGAPLQSIADAIEAKDSRRFAKAVGELTDGCNACHQSMERGFIVMRVPTDQPFANQVFPPQGKQ